MTDYRVYLDDSGHPNDQPYVVVAGYIASEAQWLDFERDWDKSLVKHCLINPFHMTDFMNQKMTALKRDHILTDLALAVRKHTAVGFALGVDILAYKQVNELYALEESHGAPYALAARGLAKKLNEWKRASTYESDQLLVFVEEGSKHYGDLEQVFKRDGLSYPKRVPKAMPAVQPVDVLGWEMFNALRTNRFSKNLKRLGHQVGSFGLFRESDLIRLCKETDVKLRSELNPGDTIAFHSDRKRKRRRTIGI